MVIQEDYFSEEMHYGKTKTFSLEEFLQTHLAHLLLKPEFRSSPACEDVYDDLDWGHSNKRARWVLWWLICGRFH